MTSTSRRAFKFDFAVLDRSGRVAVLLEVKRKVHTDLSWASEWRAMVVETMTGPTDAVLVLVTLDRVYGWNAHAAASAAPDWSFDATPLFGAYFARLRLDAASIEPRVFEEVVSLWLRDATQGKLVGNTIISGEDDLISAVRGGEVVEEFGA